MSSREELEALSSHELHDRAVHVAMRHMDIGFLWDLLRAIPASEAARGRVDLAAADVTQMSAMISDALRSGEGDEADSLRPMYLDYLEKHEG
ncbi:MAG: hypothetical protein ACM32E_07780 [Gemmatimonadota bacterium]